MAEALIAGVDIGGTNTAFGLVNAKGHILAWGSLPTTAYKTSEEFVIAVCAELRHLLSNLQDNPVAFHIEGVGIGAPNAGFYTGTVENAPNLPWKEVIPFVQYFEQHLGVKAVLTNDANAAAVGEMVFGGAQGMKNFLFITLGTGLGSGIVVNGELVHGHDGFAGELGHVIIEPGGRPCGCGRRGCLEMYCSATGIVHTYRELYPSAPANADARYLAEKAAAGEPQALEAFRKTGELLGLWLANSVAYTSPQAVFLFGGLARAGELIFQPVRESFSRNLLRIYRHKIEILPSRLKESDAAVLGAAALWWKEKTIPQS